MSKNDRNVKNLNKLIRRNREKETGKVKNKKLDREIIKDMSNSIVNALNGLAFNLEQLKVEIATIAEILNEKGLTGIDNYNVKLSETTRAFEITRKIWTKELAEGKKNSLSPEETLKNVKKGIEESDIKSDFMKKYVSR